jgi:hypothetical protein
VYIQPHQASRTPAGPTQPAYNTGMQGEGCLVSMEGGSTTARLLAACREKAVHTMSTCGGARHSPHPRTHTHTLEDGRTACSCAVLRTLCDPSYTHSIHANAHWTYTATRQHPHKLCFAPPSRPALVTTSSTRRGHHTPGAHRLMISYSRWRTAQLAAPTSSDTHTYPHTRAWCCCCSHTLSPAAHTHSLLVTGTRTCASLQPRQPATQLLPAYIWWRLLAYCYRSELH